MIKNKLIIIISIILGIVTLFMLDYGLVRIFQIRPLFSKEKIDGANYVYTTFLYKVWKCDNNNFHIGALNDTFTCPKINFVIVDETEVCAEALELFYTDDKYDYYFPCIQSGTVFVKFNTGEKITVKEALFNNRVTIKQLEEAKLVFYKYPRFQLTINPSSTCNTKQLIFANKNNYYVPITYNLFTHCLDEINVIIQNKTYSLEEALTTGKITINRLVDKMDFDAQYAEGIKEVVKDGGSILYSNLSYSLLKCNTITGNKDYYLGPKDMKYENGFCK